MVVKKKIVSYSTITTITPGRVAAEIKFAHSHDAELAEAQIDRVLQPILLKHPRIFRNPGEWTVSGSSVTRRGRVLSFTILRLSGETRDSIAENF